ncbi:MAG: sigma-54-dependent Fis family transcriptional regulator [Deltaproteobacteria bacterium]|nr:sigma-54-dependent Fis family transcriptional regulator [Deltaproteobacteria bacterium]
MREALTRRLSSRHRVVAAASCVEAREVFARSRVDLVVLDLNLPDGDGLSLIPIFLQDREAEVVVVTAYPEVQSAVRALKAGAFDYINKPFELDEFDVVVDKALEHCRLRAEVMTLRRAGPRAGGVERILGGSHPIERVREDIRRVAETPATTVLIRGETGTGKELVAEAVHDESKRRHAPIVRVNCSSIPASMMEAELFGHERGAFTDAKSSRRGLIELAHGGTLFLDEIGDLPLELQPKLLRVLESRCLRPLGGSREVEVDVRFVAATNRDLESMQAERRFREDLFFRLNVFAISVPPLRERAGDVTLLASHFLGELCRRLGKSPKTLSQEALSRLEAYRWPGNVRELSNVVERAVIVARGEIVSTADLAVPEGPHVTAPVPGEALVSPGAGAYPPLEAIERRYVLQVYEQTGRNKTRAAEILGLSRVGLREKLKGYGVT